jgi:hypothetical protein
MNFHRIFSVWFLYIFNIIELRKSRFIAEAACMATYFGFPGSVPCDLMWDSGWMKRYWNWFLSEFLRFCSSNRSIMTPLPSIWGMQSPSPGSALSHSWLHLPDSELGWYIVIHLHSIVTWRPKVAGFPPLRPGFEPGSGHWDLWWTKWRWGRFSPSTSVSPANLHSTNCSTITLIYHLGLVQ